MLCTACHRWAPALLLFGLLAVQSSAADAESRIGTATSTKPDAEGVIGANSQTLSPGTELYANETVRTGSVGRADLVLLDNTNLTVGPTSEVLLDKFVYDRTGSSGSVILQATRGAFRFVTGSQDHRAYKVSTPYGSLGVRGTTVEAVIKPERQERESVPERATTGAREALRGRVRRGTSAGRGPRRYFHHHCDAGSPIATRRLQQSRRHCVYHAVR